MRSGSVYVMTNRKGGVLYTGVTSNLPQRVWQHRNGVVEGFTKKYRCKKLVWYEYHDDLQDARRREMQIKEWQRKWKVELIEAANPEWVDLFEQIC